MFRSAKELIEGSTEETRALAKQICDDALEENAEETVANLILVAYLVTLAHNEVRPQDTSKEDDYLLVDQCLAVISKRVEEIKYAQLITDPFYDAVDRLREKQKDQELEDELPEKWA